jgi:phosphoribosyl 1,2-cyclic phosphate phosphodiesterase
LKITILGSGTSQGVPVIACPCEVCQSGDQRDKRLRSSALIESEQTNLLIDAGPDFRQQMLREKVTKLDAILITHCHKDHIAGLDDVRSFNYLFGKPMDIYASERDQIAIRQEFSYAFHENPYPGVPEFKLITLPESDFAVKDLTITPLDVRHMHMKVFGFRIGGFTYITDANLIPADTMELIKGSKVIVLNALRKQKHISHFNLTEAIDILQKLKPEKAYLTHISHMMGKHADVQPELPDNIFLAYDGLKILID